MDKERAYLLKWVEEYGIEEKIKDKLINEGYDAVVVWLETYFDGWGEAEAIASHYLL